MDTFCYLNSSSQFWKGFQYCREKNPCVQIYDRAALQQLHMHDRNHLRFELDVCLGLAKLHFVLEEHQPELCRNSLKEQNQNIIWKKNAPTTPVVPSPISSSWLFDSWTRSFAIWCSTSIWPNIVAPSFVTVISPSADIRILSKPVIENITIKFQTWWWLTKPRGPKDVRMMLATVRAASIWD